MAICSGSFVATAVGEKKVENLRQGDLLRTACGKESTIRWIGRLKIFPRSMNLQLRNRYSPIKIAANAISPGRPTRNLFVHNALGIYVEGALVPVMFLRNGTTIRQICSHEEAVYYGIELENPALLLVEGVPVESVTPARWGNFFPNNVERFKDIGSSHPPTLEPFFVPNELSIVNRLRASVWGGDVGTLQSPDVRLATNMGAIFPVAESGRRYRFILPVGIRTARILSRYKIPAELSRELPEKADFRRLGIPVTRIRMWERHLKVDLEFSAITIEKGFRGVYGPEPTHVWTDGEAAIPESLCAPFQQSAFAIEIETLNTGGYQGDDRTPWGRPMSADEESSDEAEHSTRNGPRACMIGVSGPLFDTCRRVLEGVAQFSSFHALPISNCMYNPAEEDRSSGSPLEFEMFDLAIILWAGLNDETDVNRTLDAECLRSYVDRCTRSSCLPFVLVADGFADSKGDAKKQYDSQKADFYSSATCLAEVGELNVPHLDARSVLKQLASRSAAAGDLFAGRHLRNEAVAETVQLAAGLSAGLWKALRRTGTHQVMCNKGNYASHESRSDIQQLPVVDVPAEELSWAISKDEVDASSVHLTGSICSQIVQALYAAILKRQPDQAGFSSKISALQQLMKSRSLDESVEILVRSFLDSTEYKNKIEII